MKQIRKTFGFTLVEILVVVAIIATLATIGFLAFAREPQEARNNKTDIDLQAIQSQIELEMMKTGNAPTVLQK